RWGRVAGVLRVAKKEQHQEEHGEDAQGGDSKDVFDAEAAVGPRSDIRAGGTADVHHGVVNRVADGTDIFFGSTPGGADDAGFDQRNPERGKNQDAAYEQAQRHSVAYGREPVRAN